MEEYNTEFQKILSVVKQSESILLLGHTSPDMDSISSCLILKEILDKMNKKTDVVSFDEIDVQTEFVDPNKKVIVTKPGNINFNQYQTLFILDANEFDRVGLMPDFSFKGTIINIDHHEDGGVGDIKIIDRKAGSTCTLLYYLFKAWDVELNNDILNRVLMTLVADTEVFHYSIYSSPFIFRTVSELMDQGASYDNALYHADQSYDVMIFKYWAEAIKRIKVDKKFKFAYTIIPHPIYHKYEKFGGSTRQIADKFLRNINDTNFGIVIVETESGAAKVSIRTRTPGFYVLNLVKKLGGGGHLTGGGTVIGGIPFDQAVIKVLETARKFATRNELQTRIGV